MAAFRRCHESPRNERQKQTQASISDVDAASGRTTHTGSLPTVFAGSLLLLGACLLDVVGAAVRAGGRARLPAALATTLAARRRAASQTAGILDAGNAIGAH